jgi:hypothetical protein
MLELAQKTNSLGSNSLDSNSLGLSQEAFEKLEAMLDEGLASIEAGRTIPIEGGLLAYEKGDFGSLSN